MSILDAFIVLMLVMGLWQGYRNGLLRSLVGLFGWLMALMLASYFAKSAAPFFVTFTDSPVLAMLMGFIAVALGVIVVLQLLLWLLSGVLTGLKIGILDKLAGAVFASGKNLLVIVLLLSMIAPFIQRSMVWQNSPMAQALLPLSPFAIELSKRVAAGVRDNTQAGLQQWGESSRKDAGFNQIPR